jgi:hypothetical protein
MLMIDMAHDTVLYYCRWQSQDISRHWFQWQALMLSVWVQGRQPRRCSRCVGIYSFAFKVFYSPADAQVNCLKNSFKIYIEIDIRRAPTCFTAVTPSTGSTLRMFGKVTVVKIAP